MKQGKGKTGKKLSNLKKLAIGAALTAAASGSAFWVVKNGKLTFPLPVSYATEISDGDTFMTADKSIIRLAGIDAPETGRCGADEATKLLKKLVANKPLYMKVVFTDATRRLESYVYTPDGFVNQKMLESGWVMLWGNNNPELQRVADEAKTQKRGVFGSNCTQTENLSKPTCKIIGNNNKGKGNKQYRFPGCARYSQTEVQLYWGDEWFCTEVEAKKSGYIRGADCYDKSYHN